jgi:hypothetical protein
MSQDATSVPLAFQAFPNLPGDSLRHSCDMNFPVTLDFHARVVEHDESLEHRRSHLRSQLLLPHMVYSVADLGRAASARRGTTAARHRGEEGIR